MNASELRNELANRSVREGLALAKVTTPFDLPSQLRLVSFSEPDKLQDRNLSLMLFSAHATPDGRQIAGTITQGIYSPTMTLGVIDPVSRVVREAGVKVNVISFAFCEAADQFVFSGAAQVGDEALTGLHLAKPGANESQLLFSLAYDESFRGYPRSLSWSRDCTKFVYEFGDQVYVYDLQGRTKRVLAAGTAPAWSPTGDQIAYIDPDRVLTITTQTGRGTKKVRRERAAYGAPSWSPEGDYLSVGMRWGLIPGTFLVVIRIRDTEVLPIQRMFKGIGREWGWMRVPELLNK